jgi:hypothetical protein
MAATGVGETEKGFLRLLSQAKKNLPVSDG